MDPLSLAIGAVIGAVIAALAAHQRAERRHAEQVAALRERVAVAEAAAHTDEQLLAAHRQLSVEAYQSAAERLVDVATSRYQALENTALGHWQNQGAHLLTQLDGHTAALRDLEAQRRSEAGVLSGAIEALRVSSTSLRDEARQLTHALRDNTVRGTWGEVQLRRVLEQAGMDRHADFAEQVTVTDTDGKRARPDVIVALPEGRSVIIDSKAPLDRYLDAANCDDPERRRALELEHARAVAQHVVALSKRNYPDSVPGSLDLVVMFVPGDAFLATAANAQPALIEQAWERGVVLASPSTLLGFLRAAALGWREHRAAEQAHEVAATGRELHDRLSVFIGHLNGVGGALDRAVSAYNDAAGSLERRVMPQARRFSELGSSRTIAEIATVDNDARQLALPTDPEPSAELPPAEPEQPVYDADGW